MVTDLDEVLNTRHEGGDNMGLHNLSSLLTYDDPGSYTTQCLNMPRKARCRNANDISLN
jgi:hypothetical protein